MVKVIDTCKITTNRRIKLNRDAMKILDAEEGDFISIVIDDNGELYIEKVVSKKE